MDRRRNRHSMGFSTPQSQKLISSQSRRSVTALDLDSSSAIGTLFETLMNDPTKRDIIMKLMIQDKRKIEEIKRKQNKLKKDLENPSPLRKAKQKFVCESPSALLRRRVLEQHNEDNAGSNSCVMIPPATPSSLPFECLLQGVIAYVEVRSNNCDRSGGAKALMRAMGAIVKDTFTGDVTHVVFKDGSFDTYQKAKLMNTHLVSVLWLEAIRRNHARVPEKNYPALGTDMFKANMSLLCEELQRDYEDVLRDELSRNMVVNWQNEDNVSSTTSRTCSSIPSDQSSNNITEDVIDVSQDCDAVSVISKASRRLSTVGVTSVTPTTPDSLKLHSPILTSDSEYSEEGVINRQIMKKVGNNLSQLENKCKSVDSIPNNSDVTVDKNKENCKELTDNFSSESTSLLITVKTSETKKKCKRSLYNHVDVEDGLFHSPIENRRRNRATVHLNMDDDQELINCKEAVQTSGDDMEITCGVNDVFVTKRKPSSISKISSSLNDCDEKSTQNKGNLVLEQERPATEDLTNRKTPLKKSTIFEGGINGESCQGISNRKKSAKRTGSAKNSPESSHVKKIAHRSSKHETRKSTSSKSHSTQEISSLRLSINSSSAKTNITSNDEICTTEEKGKSELVSNKVNHIKIMTRKSSSTQELSLLRLSADTHIKRNSTNNIETIKPQQMSNQNIEESSLRQNTKKPSSKSAKSNSVQELSSLRLSTDSSRTRSNITNNDERYVTTEVKEKSEPVSNKVSNTKMMTRKSSSTQELSLRLSADSSMNNISPNNKKVIEVGTNSTNGIRKSSSSQDSSSRLSEKNRKASDDIYDSQPKTRKRKSRSQSRTSGENSFQTISSDSSLVHTLDSLVQHLDDDISRKKDKSESPSKKQKISNLLNHSESDSEIGTQKVVPRRSVRRMKMNSNASPEDQQLPDLDDFPSKEKKKARRLYNLNYNFVEGSIPCNENDKESTTAIFKKPVPVTTAPILLTPSALAYVQKLKLLKPTSSDKDQNLSKKTSTVKKTTQKTPLKKIAETQFPIRKSGRIEKQKNDVDKDSNSSIGITPQKNRRSSLDFVPKIIKTPAKSKYSDGSKKLKKSSIVCTRFHRPDVQVFQQIVKRMGKFFVEDEVTENTTHLVVGESKRTINMLRAIARGCWILKSEWLYKSLEAREWLAEEDFELTEFSPAVQQCRQQQQAFGSLYSMDIFENCGLIYIARSSVPRCSDLQELVRLGKGEITHLQRSALIVVGEFIKHDGVTCVSEKWILDSVMFNKKKAFKNYLITGK